jgi:pimeloyl-ACP methyl ester carboxylesterase
LAVVGSQYSVVGSQYSVVGSQYSVVGIRCSAMIQENFIHYQKHVLHYVKTGNGKHPLLVFHGFGQDHTLYVPMLRSLSGKYTLYIIDLFFHGKSEWNDGERPLEKKTWNKIIGTLLHEQQIDSFSILAYSLGGKFALTTLEGYPRQIKNIFLVAPDGIKTSFWYSIATYPPFLRNLFKTMIDRHDRFLMIARTLNHLRLVDKGLAKFADYQMGTAEKRKRVYYSWVVFRHMTFNLRKLGSLINENEIALTVIAGEYDKVIRPSNMHRLLKHVRDYKLEILESGHTGLMHESLRLL